MRKVFLLTIFIINVSFAIIIDSNYPLPNNNIKELFMSLSDQNDIVEIIKKTQSFKSIKLNKDKLKLVRFPLIEKIYIKGNKSYWDSEIQGIAGVYKGKYISNKDLALIPIKLKQFYYDNGFLDALINVNFKINNKGYGKLFINIKEGNKYKIKDIKFISDRNLNKDIIKKYKDTLDLENKAFNFSKIETQIEKLLNLIKDKGYYDSYISIYSLHKVNDEEVILYISIAHGFNYKLLFIGNYIISSDTLKKLADFDKYGVNYYQISLFAKKIEDYYKSKGFLDANVDFDYKEEVAKKIAYVKIYIYEGKRYEVESINIKSDHKLPDNIKNKILSIKGKYYDNSLITSILENYIKKLHSKGYKNAYYNINISKNRHLVLNINLYKGKKFIIEKFIFHGYNPNIDINTPVNYEGNIIVNLLEDIKQKLKESGYLDAEVNLYIKIKEKKDKISVYPIYKIKTGELYYTSIPFFYGTWHLKIDTLKWNIKKNTPYKKETFDNQLNFLYTSYIFNFINPDIYIDKKRKKVDQIFILSEDKRGLFQGSLGYNSVEKFKGSLFLILKNLFDYGFELNSYIDISTINTNYNLSFGNRLLPKFSSLFGSIFSSFQNHKYYNLIKTGAKLEYMKRPNKWAKQYINLEYSRNKLKNTFVFDKNPYEKYLLFFGLEYDDRNNKIFPTKGFYFRGNFGKTFKDVEYFFGNFNLRYYYKLFFLVLSQNFSSGGNFLSINKLPISERYFLGGLFTIRGFGYEEISNNGNGGNSYAYINTDIRFAIAKSFNLYGFVFYDMGNIFPTKKDYFKFKTRKSAGAGVLVPTPAGAFIFDYAHILDRKPGESKYRLEFSISVVF